MSPWQEPMYGQCRCGASMTVDHLRNHCPLRPQQATERSVAFMEWWYSVERLDVSHVAVLGEN